MARAAGLTSTTEKTKPAGYTVVGSHFRVDTAASDPVGLARPAEDFQFNNGDPILTPSTTGTNVLTYPADGVLLVERVHRGRGRPQGQRVGDQRADRRRARGAVLLQPAVPGVQRERHPPARQRDPAAEGHRHRHAEACGGAFARPGRGRGGGRSRRPPTSAASGVRSRSRWPTPTSPAPRAWSRSTPAPPPSRRRTARRT